MEEKKCQALLIIILCLYSASFCTAVEKSSSSQNQGKWELLLNNTGVVAMHMALTHHNTVILLDQISPGRAGYRVKRHCVRSDSSCYAHSVEYDIFNNKVRPLRIETDPFCSSGSFLSNGTLLQMGGNGEGGRRIRFFRPCLAGQVCDWRQSRSLLSENRWYASAQRLPEDNDRVILVGGRKVYSYEFVPKMYAEQKSHNLPFLRDTDDQSSERNNFYPFLHLSSDGNLFIFANRDSILFDYRRNRVVKTFPRIPGEGERTYPSTGSSVILPLDHTDGFEKVEVMICGGAGYGKRAALSSCGRMLISGENHKWVMENMPEPRLLHDMIILPTGDVLIINGAQRGSAGWGNAADPSLNPYLYNPNQRRGQRFTILKSTKIPRMYHSSAILLPNGRVLVAGSNPNKGYVLKNVEYPTELRLQAFVPHYMDRQFHDARPINVSVQYNEKAAGVKYGDEFTVLFWLLNVTEVEFSVYAPPFATHSIGMNQRMLRLKCNSMVRRDGGWVSVVLEAPPSANVAPAGFYMLNVVNHGVPSESSWVRFLHG